MQTAKYKEIAFTDADIANKDDFIPDGEYNPYNVCPWLFHDHGFVVGIVFARNAQDALDELADADKLDRYLIDLTDKNDRDDYLSTEVTPGYDPNVPEFVDADGVKYWWKEGREPDFLGNASEPFDVEGLDYIVLPNPPFSFVALFNAMGGT